MCFAHIKIMAYLEDCHTKSNPDSGRPFDTFLRKFSTFFTLRLLVVNLTFVEELKNNAGTNIY